MGRSVGEASSTCRADLPVTWEHSAVRQQEIPIKPFIVKKLIECNKYPEKIKMKFPPEHSRELHSLTDRNFLKPQDLKEQSEGFNC